jgi:hypothetical protein
VCLCILEEGKKAGRVQHIAKLQKGEKKAEKKDAKRQLYKANIC